MSHYETLRDTIPHYFTLRDTTRYYKTLCHTTPHLHHTMPHYETLRDTTIHYDTLRVTTRHCATIELIYILKHDLLVLLTPFQVLNSNLSQCMKTKTNYHKRGERHFPENYDNPFIINKRSLTSQQSIN